MGNMTYEQFAEWCEHWGYTVDEGHEAMCFVTNLIGQNFWNRMDYLNEVEEHPSTSEVINKFAIKRKENATVLFGQYTDFANEIFFMLLNHDKEAPTTCDKFQPKED